MNTAAYLLHMGWGDLGSSHVCSLVGGSVSESPQSPRLVDSVGLPVKFLSHLGSSILLPILTLVPRLHPLFGSMKHVQMPTPKHWMNLKESYKRAVQRGLGGSGGYLGVGREVDKCPSLWPGTGDASARGTHKHGGEQTS